MSIVGQITQTPEGMRLYQQERTILGLTELVCKLMTEKDVTKKELADKLGRNKSFITHLLSGTRNLTVRSLSDLLWALDYRIHPDAEPIPEKAKVSRATDAASSAGQRGVSTAPYTFTYEVVKRKLSGSAQAAVTVGITMTKEDSEDPPEKGDSKSPKPSFALAG